DVPVRLAVQGANGFVAAEERLALEGAADHIDEPFGQVRQVSQRPVLHLPVRSVRLPQQVTRVRALSMLPLDLGHMHADASLFHPIILAFPPCPSMGPWKLFLATLGKPFSP